MGKVIGGAMVFLIALAHGMVFALACVDKILTGLPPWFAEAIDRTFLVNLPGGALLQFYGILVLEASIALGCTISILRMEFLFKSQCLFLKISLLLSMFTFVVLGTGQRIFAQWGGDAAGFQGASNSFTCFGVSLLCLLMVQKYRPIIDTKITN
ncbi:MAG TPA: hypothetical protein VEL47_03995 [Myxococcota bacterium]|nr:hypothetical protein [Myxococcota bacterium]